MSTTASADFIGCIADEIKEGFLQNKRWPNYTQWPSHADNYGS